jgi:hypothetical protein
MTCSHAVGNVVVSTRNWQVSSGDGTNPRWAKSGNIYYQTLNGEVMEVAVKTHESTVEIVGETRLFDTRAASEYHISENGQRFLEVYDESSDTASPLVLVTSWLADFESRR